jgi:glycosyltransferase involved in cell wall biosynthesis
MAVAPIELMGPRRSVGTAVRVLFVDHETRLSGGERDLVDLVHALGPAVDAHVALPGEGALAEALRSEGATVHVVAMNDALRHVSRWELARRPHMTLRHARAAMDATNALAALARRLRPEIVHSNSMKSHLLSVPAARAADAPLVWHVRDVLEAGWLRRAFNTGAAFGPSRVICISDAVAEPFTGRVSGKTRRVYNGIRPSYASPADIAAWRRRLGAASGDIVIGMVGQIAHWKGQDLFVEAAAKLGHELPDTRFVVAGECLFPENEAEFEARVHRRAAYACLGHRFVWAGAVDGIEPFMGALDILVHASRLPEPFGRVIVEAMAQGTPVVTTRIGAGPELVPPDAGVVVEPDDVRALVAALQGLVADRSRLARMSDAARAAARRFDIAHTGAGVLDVYRELLA